MRNSLEASDIGSTELVNRYLELLRKTLTFSLWDGQDRGFWRPRGVVQRTLYETLRKRGIEVVGPANETHREFGLDWPRLAHTMTGARRLESLQECVETALRESIPGDLIETGVWRGGSCILMRGILSAYQVTDRTVWVADSFAGLPAPDSVRYPADAGDSHHKRSELAVQVAEVRENFKRYGLLDEQVKFLVGWFKDTLPTAPIDRLAVLRLDGDMYESTVDALNALYPRLSDGGFCIVDDYGAVEGCRRAVENYRSEHGIHDPIIKIDLTGVFWRKNSSRDDF